MVLQRDGRKQNSVTKRSREESSIIPSFLNQKHDYESNLEIDRDRLDKLASKRREWKEALRLCNHSSHLKTTTTASSTSHNTYAQQNNAADSDIARTKCKEGVWMSCPGSSFFLMDGETEAKPLVQTELAEIENHLRDLCAEIQEKIDSREE